MEILVVFLVSLFLFGTVTFLATWALRGRGFRELWPWGWPWPRSSRSRTNPTRPADDEAARPPSER